EIEQVAIWRGAVRRDEPRRAKAVVRDAAERRRDIRLRKPPPAPVERHRAGVFRFELWAVNRDALHAWFDVVVVRRAHAQFMAGGRGERLRRQRYRTPTHTGREDDAR